MPFASAIHRKSPLGDFSRKEIPIGLKDYLSLVDYTGRVILAGKSGYINTSTPQVLERLGYMSKDWVQTQCSTMSRMKRAVGSVDSIKNYCEVIGQRWIW